LDLGDSNEVLGATGRNHGIQYAFQNLGFNLYGPGIYSANEANGGAGGVGYYSGHNGNAGRVMSSVVPGVLDVYNPYEVAGLTATGPQFSPNYPHNLVAGTSDTSANNGFTLYGGPVYPASPFDVNSSWRFRYRYGTFTSGTGAFRPQVRQGNFPFSLYAQAGSSVSTNTGASGLQTYTLNLGAATRDDLLQVQWYGNGTQVDGPAYLLWQSGDDTAKTAGLQYTSLIGRGGQGLYEYIQCMQKSSAAITEIMDFIAGAQNNTVQPMMLFCINSGLNDRNDDGIQSLGPNGTLDCSTPAGYADNMRGIIITIQNAWALNGYPRSNLFFLLQPSHPISNPDDAELIGYRAALSALTSDYQNCAVQNLAYQPLNTTLQANAAAWYNAGGGDTSHMTQTGYEQFCTLWVKELLK
jgi:hypothetical protein